MAVKLHSSFAIHPGPFIKAEVLDHYRMSIVKAAAHLGVSRPSLNNMLNGKASLSPEMAMRFEKAFGISAGALLRMQSNYDLARARAVAGSIHVKRVPEPA